MGRKPKPTRQQIIEGDPAKRGKRKLECRLKAEPVPVRGLPCPRHLRGVARVAWDFWVAELEAMQIDCRPDAMMLEGACRNYARAVEADSVIEREGTIIEELIYHKGEPLKDATRKRKHPAVGISNAAWTLVKSFCAEFGLSPASRSRLAVQRKDTADADLHALLSGPELTPEERRRLIAGDDQGKKVQ